LPRLSSKVSSAITKVTSTKTRDLMQTPAVTVPEEMTLEDAARVLWAKNIGSVIVVNKQDRMIGILTERDMLFAISKELIGKDVPVSSIMSQTDLIASPNEGVATVLDRMINHGVGRLPVVSKDTGKLAGIITRTDVIRAYDRAVELLSKSEPT
jgi:CBS domain-containing protein